MTTYALYVTLGKIRAITNYDKKIIGACGIKFTLIPSNYGQIWTVKTAQEEQVLRLGCREIVS